MANNPQLARIHMTLWEHELDKDANGTHHAPPWPCTEPTEPGKEVACANSVDFSLLEGRVVSPEVACAPKKCFVHLCQLTRRVCF